MRKIYFCVLLLAAALFPLLAGRSAEPVQQPKEPPGKLAELMHRKLENSQKVLEGIALNDHEKIGKHGEELIAISKATEWKVVKTPQYELHSNEFRRIADQLVRAAKDKNLDGATLAYLDLTLSCVKCHKYVREVRMARVD
jgi:hypothetical protein